MKITADFPTKTLKGRRQWSEVFWALNENNFSPRILYPAKLSFKNDRAIKIFHKKKEIKIIYDHQATNKEDSTRNSAHRK
jgi:hypothetical protein